MCHKIDSKMQPDMKPMIEIPTLGGQGRTDHPQLCEF